MGHKFCYKLVLGVFILAIVGKFFFSFWQAVYLLRISSILERHERGFQELQILGRILLLGWGTKEGSGMNHSVPVISQGNASNTQT